MYIILQLLNLHLKMSNNETHACHHPVDQMQFAELSGICHPAPASQASLGHHPPADLNASSIRTARNIFLVSTTSAEILVQVPVESVPSVLSLAIQSAVHALQEWLEIHS